MKRKIFAWMLVVVMVLSAVPAELIAWESNGGYTQIGDVPSYLPQVATTTPAALDISPFSSHYAPFDLIISSQTAEVGEEISVTVSIANNPGFAAMPLRINFLDGLTFQRFYVGNNFQNAIFEATYGIHAGVPAPAGTISNYIYFVWARDNNFTANGELLSLYFAVNGTAEGGFYPITATFADRYGLANPIDYDGNVLAANIFRGGVTVPFSAPRPCGDVSGDGIVDAFDATLIARHLVGHEDLHLLPGTTYPISQFGFNINYGRVTPESRLPGNSVTVMDAVWILRFLSGHDVVICACDSAPLNEIFGMNFDTGTNAVYVDVTARENAILQVSVLEDVVGGSGDWGSGRLLASNQIPVSQALENEQIRVPVSAFSENYFVVRAVLINSSGAELSEPYYCIDGTTAFATFLSKTVDCFDDRPGEVIPIGDTGEIDNNFVVTAEGVRHIAVETGSVSVDGNIYTISNAPACFASVLAGDKIILESPTELYTIKVLYIGTNGSTVTIVEDDGVNVLDFFEFIKIDIAIEIDTYDDGVSPFNQTMTRYGGLSLEIPFSSNPFALPDFPIQSVPVYIPNNSAGGVSVGVGYNFHFDGVFSIDMGLNMVITYSSTILPGYLRVSVEVAYELSLTANFESDVTVHGKLSLAGLLTSALVLGADAGVLGKIVSYVTPTDLYLHINIGGGVAVSIDYERKGVLGFNYHHQIRWILFVPYFHRLSFHGINTVTHDELNYFSIETTGFGRISAELRIGAFPAILSDNLFAGLRLYMGTEGRATLRTAYGASQSATYRHACSVCFRIGLYDVREVFIGLEVNFWPLSPREISVLRRGCRRTPVPNMARVYFSLNHSPYSIFSQGRSQVGFGDCPNIQHRISINPLDRHGNTNATANVNITAPNNRIIPGFVGRNYRWLYPGLHTITANASGYTFSPVTFLSDEESIFPGAQVEVIIGGTPLPPPVDYWVYATAGFGMTMAIQEDGSLWEWGRIISDTSGSGMSNRYSPVRIMNNVASVSIGMTHAAAILNNGNLQTWGDNAMGQLGDGSFAYRSSPTSILENVIAVSAGSNHTMAIQSDNSLWGWGSNLNGQIGNGEQGFDARRNSPVHIMDDVIAVSAGDSHTMAIRSDNSLWGWGNNGMGALGDGTNISQNSPMHIMDNVIAVAAGVNRTMAIRSDGTLWAWGVNGDGGLGIGSVTSARLEPIQIMDNVVAVSLGSTHSIAVRNDNSVWAWGSNFFGQVGDGTTQQQLSPAVVNITNDAGEVIQNAKIASAADAHTVVVTIDRRLYTWGFNNHGQLGSGTPGNSLEPVRVIGGVS